MFRLLLRQKTLFKGEYLMFKIKNTKRALLASVLALVVCISMLVGSTFAWFTDSVTSGQNKIQSGNLDVELYFTDEITADDAGNDTTVWKKVDDKTDIFGYDLWEPGHTKVAYFKVVNEGSLALKYQLSADVYDEVAGKNKANEEFLLSDHIKTALVDADATREEILAMTGTPLKASFAMSAKALEAKASEVVGLAIWMPTSVGNEANHNGKDVPSITFGINLIATQEMSESDSFGKDYDVQATYPNIPDIYVLTGSTKVNDTATEYEIGLLNNSINDEGKHSKQGSITVPADAVADGATQITVTLKKLPTADDTVIITQDQEAVTYEINVEGIKKDNIAPIQVVLDIGKNVNFVAVYHKNVKVDGAVYDPNEGQVTFYTNSFSPYTVVTKENPTELTETTVPVADVEENPATKEGEKDSNGELLNGTYENVPLDWKGYGGYNTRDDKQTLKAVYKFTSPHDLDTVDSSIYKNWHCDYYVKLVSDKLTVLPAYSIVLGGNYGGYGWVGFDNPEVETNTWIPLLGSVFPDEGNISTWTYAEVVGLVKEFLCGVGVSTGSTTDLSGAKFVVELRLINPENTNEYISVNTVTYDFESDSSTYATYVAQ